MKTLVGPCFITLALVLAGCQKPIAQAPDIRPVRVLEVAAVQAASVYEYAGEIRPRIESRLGFRVPGKIISRRSASTKNIMPFLNKLLFDLRMLRNEIPTP